MNESEGFERVIEGIAITGNDNGFGQTAVTRDKQPNPSLQRAVLLALCASVTPAFAASCEELQLSIEARIRANGVANFTVTPVDAAASAPGQIVGTCDQGRKKLLYLRGAAASAPAKQSPAASGVVTECADGRVLAEGTCKK